MRQLQATPNKHIKYDDNDSNDPRQRGSKCLDDRCLVPRLESGCVDSDPKVRRRMGPCDDQRSPRAFTERLLPTGIIDPDALPAKHPDVREPASDQEQPPRCGTDILRRNTEAADLRVCLLCGRQPRRRRILVLRRVPQVWRGRRGSPEDQNLPVRKQGERHRSATEQLDPRNRPTRDTVL